MPMVGCSKCSRRMKPAVNGVDVVEHASFGPYKLWMADEYECDGCGHKVITGFGGSPVSQYHDLNFLLLINGLDPKNRRDMY